MTRTILMALTAAGLALSAPAFANQNALREGLKMELKAYGFKDVDVDKLSTGQVAHIKHLLYSGHSNARIRGNIGAVLGDSLLKGWLRR